MVYPKNFIPILKSYLIVCTPFDVKCQISLSAGYESIQFGLKKYSLGIGNKKKMMSLEKYLIEIYSKFYRLFILLTIESSFNVDMDHVHMWDHGSYDYDLATSQEYLIPIKF